MEDCLAREHSDREMMGIVAERTMTGNCLDGQKVRRVEQPLEVEVGEAFAVTINEKNEYPTCLLTRQLSVYDENMSNQALQLHMPASSFCCACAHLASSPASLFGSCFVDRVTTYHDATRLCCVVRTNR